MRIHFHVHLFIKPGDMEHVYVGVGNVLSKTRRQALSGPVDKLVGYALLTLLDGHPRAALGLCVPPTGSELWRKRNHPEARLVLKLIADGDPEHAQAVMTEAEQLLEQLCEQTLPRRRRV